MGIYLIVCPLVFLASFVDAIAGGGGLISLLYNMKMFYMKYPIFQSVTGKLSWTHYCELLYISDDDKRSFYEKKSINSNWSVRALKRQISSSLFERLLL